MGRYPRRAALCFTTLTVALAGCSSEEQPVPKTTGPEAGTSAGTYTTELPPLNPGSTAPPEAFVVSPGGVTTEVRVPSDATESQYGQACLAAKRWLDEQGGDPLTLVESYLQTVQDPAYIGAGNFNTPWAQLTPGQQAGVILSANGAANGQCS